MTDNNEKAILVKVEHESKADLNVDQQQQKPATDEENKTTSEDSKKVKPSRQVSIRTMLRYATWLDYLLMFVGGLCGAANGAALAGFSILLGGIFDTLNSPNPDTATNISIIFLYIGLATLVSAGLQVGLWILVSERLTVRVREEYFKAILSQDVAFFDSAESGSLTSKVAENSLMFREAFGEKFAALFQFAAMFIGGIIVGFLYVWQLCLVILGLTPLLAGTGYMMATTLNKIISGQLDSYADAGSIAEESFTLIRTVTAFGLQKERLKRYDAELTTAAKQSEKAGRAMGTGFGLAMFVYFGSYAVAFYVGAVLVINDKVAAEQQFPMPSPPSVLTPFCAIGQIVPPECSNQKSQNITFETAADVCGCPFCRCGCYYSVPPDPISITSTCITGGDVLLTFFSVLIGSFAIGQAAPSITAFQNGQIAAGQLFAVIDRIPSIDSNSTEGTVLTKVKGDILFENVAFTYPTRLEAPVFKCLNLHIPAGKRVALVGESGSGKSTCIALIERYYDPIGGRITLDGHDLKSINIKSLRSFIGLVSQEPILFGTTIMENVRFGRQDASDAEIIQACKDANADGFIQNLTDGYQTYVTSSLVSGGQKQRIAIARALLRNPQILLLDEATAALDNESERLVNDAINCLLNESLSGSRTTIVIAHRLSSIRACEKIIVMEKGIVVEEGSHDELIAHENGLYASLIKLSEGAGKQELVQQQEQNVVITSPPKEIQDKKAIDESRDHDEKSIVVVDQEKTDEPEEVEATSSSTTCCGCFSRKKKAPKKPKQKDIPISRAFKYAKPERLWFIPAILAASANGLTFPVFALLFANLLETFFFTNSSAIASAAAVWSLAFLGLAIGNGISIFFQNAIFGKINGRMTSRVRSEVLKHVLSFEIGFFDSKDNTVGSLTSKLASDAAVLKGAISDRVAVGFQNLATMIAGFTIAFVASWQVSLVVFAMFPALAISGAVELWVMSGMANNDSKALEAASNTLTEAVNGIRTVNAFEMQAALAKLYHDQLAGPLRLAKRKGLLAGIGFGFSQGVMFFAYALTFWYGSQLVANQTITFKDLNQSLFGILMTAMALGQAAAMAPDIAKGQSAVNSIFGLLDRKSEINPFSEEGQKPSVFLGDLTFQDVEFAYPTRPEIAILSKFNLTIKHGQTIAFVGTSGSGKSTLVLLLEHFYNCTSGCIKIDGIDVKHLNVEWLRSQIGIVSQEPALFRGSIKDNIASGRIGASFEEVVEAAKMSNAHDFITAFPNGYDTDLQTASGVSGGQKQRIAIARALIRDPKLLLLDEATSALDETSQKLVQDALDQLMARTKRTVVIVAHRLSTIRNADIIVVLQNGVVVEQGSFDDLASRPNGAFQALLKAQDKH